jgi:hypothetical protein
MLARTPEELRKAATHYRLLASRWITDQAREPLNAMPELLEQEAEQQWLLAKADGLGRNRASKMRTELLSRIR